MGTASFDDMDAADEDLWSDLTQLHAQISMMQAYMDVLSPRLSRAIEFSPPELMLKGEPLSAKSDVYSFGLFMMQLLIGWAPGKHETDRDLNKVSASS
jgi:serine/threonine protein kinase